MFDFILEQKYKCLTCGITGSNNEVSKWIDGECAPVNLKQARVIDGIAEYYRCIQAGATVHQHTKEEALRLLRRDFEIAKKEPMLKYVPKYMSPRDEKAVKAYLDRAVHGFQALIR